MLYASCTHAQDKSRFLVGPAFSLNQCHRTLINADGERITDALIELNDSREMPKGGFNIGLGILHRFSPLFGLETGILYSNKGYQTVPVNFVFGDSLTPAGGSFKSIYTFHYLDIPLKANFTFGKGKVRFIAGAGLAANIFLTEIETRVITDPNGKRERESSAASYPYNRLNLSALASAGVACQLSDKVELRVEPNFSHGLLGIIDSTPIDANLWTVGIGFSCYFDPGK